MKICIRCKENKSLTDYGKNKNKPDGLMSFCKACKHIENVEWRAKNSNYDANRYSLIGDEYRAYSKKRYEENKISELERHKKWQKNNPEKVSNIKHKRRVLKKQNPSYQITNRFLKRLYLSACIFCGSKNKIEADHIIPIARGGSHSEGNLQPLCKKCNSSKGSKLNSEWKYANK